MAEEKKTNIKEEVKKKIEESKSAIQKTSGKDKKTEAKVEFEREYIVPLKKGSLNVPKYRRAKKAVKTLKEFLAQHMKIRDRDLNKIKIDINLNNELWYRGIKKPANKIKVKAKKIGDFVFVELAEIPKVVGYKIKRLEKRKAANITPEAAKPTEKSDDDKDNDGVSDKKEAKEDAKSEAIKDAKVNQEAAKASKHTTKGPHKNAKPMINQPKK